RTLASAVRECETVEGDCSSSPSSAMAAKQFKDDNEHETSDITDPLLVKQVYRCWAEVDLNALRENLAWIRHRVGPQVKILTVVKADAYGHGLKQIAALLMQSGTDIFGVANLTEARVIHGVGEGWPVLMLGACLPDEVEPAVRDAVSPTISSL